MQVSTSKNQPFVSRVTLYEVTIPAYYTVATAGTQHYNVSTITRGLATG